ncbi:MAG: hypothetical protein S4CHLAM2_03850 [Chlamydiales bacterium]|nr:hypothetical protein [Chlamydiales bacterium]
MAVSSCTSPGAAGSQEAPLPPSVETLLDRFRTQPPSTKNYIYEAIDTTSEMPALFLTGPGIDLFIQSCALQTDVEICPTFWVGDLARQTQKFMTSSHQKAAFFVNSSKQLTGHFSTVYMEKNNAGKLRIFISDSLGTEGNGIINFQSTIMKCFYPLSDSIETVYLMRPKRQQGGSECALFCLADILEIVNTPDFFATLTTEEDEGIFRNVVSPPAALMKLTQSFTLLEKYQAENLTLRANPLLGHAEMPFSDFIASGTVEEIDQEGLPKKRNSHALLFLSRVLETIIDRL